MTRLAQILARIVFVAMIVAAVGVGGAAGWLVVRYGRNLPNHEELLSYVPPTGTKVYAADGSFMAEFASEHRIVTPIAQIPPLVIHAFLAAEDRGFFSHGGVNPFSIMRAAIADIVRFRRGERPLGASTITQQLVRHFMLTNAVSVSRKIKEALLSYRIEHYLSKDRILEIYLNEIYLGDGAYGVAAAADAYFHKPLDQLTPAEAALLAALPKAPHSYNPLRDPAAAKVRRDWVLTGMAEMGWLSAAEAKAAIAEPIRLAPPPGAAGTDADAYFVEAVRRELIARFGQKRVYQGGLVVHTSYNPADQAMAERAFRGGLAAYDRRHGWRGPVAHYPTAGVAAAALSGTADPPGIGDWQLAAVVAIDRGAAEILTKYGDRGRIPFDQLLWARHTAADQRLGPPVRRVADVVRPGDIVLVERLPAAAVGSRSLHRMAAVPVYGLRQIPNVGGGMVVMDPNSGHVLALVGGWDFRQSQFDRGTQAMRQPGSAIKPFVYLTAMEDNFTPSSIVEDTPIEIDQGPGLPKWRPVNYEDTFVGPTTLRQALVHSRNLATARLATMIGLPAIARTVEQFGIMDKMPLYYSMALGAGDTTVLRLTTAYAMLDNGGHWLRSSLIDLVQDRNGRILYQSGANYCVTCYIAAGPRSAADAGSSYQASPLPPGTVSYLPGASYAPDAMLYRPNKADPLADPIADYQIISMMEGVVQHGTGTAVAAVGKPLAGKTGTSSNWNDAWFVGFSPNLAAGVFVGFDEPRTLGNGEAGGQVAAPIFRDFMQQALSNVPATPFPVPPDAVIVRVDRISGQPATADDPNTVLEAFRPGTEPGSDTDAAAPPSDDEMATTTDATSGDDAVPIPVQAEPAAGTGGLY